MGKVVTPRSQTQQGQLVTKLETHLQNILVGNVNTIQGDSTKTSSIMYFQTERRSEGRNITGMCVISDTIV